MGDVNGQGHAVRSREFIGKPFDTVEVKIRIHYMHVVCWLHKKLQAHNRYLERALQARTEEMQIGEDRHRSLTELAVDWC